MEYQLNFQEGSKDDAINTIIDFCDTMPASDKVTAFAFGEQRDMVLHIYKDEEYDEDSKQWNLVRICTFCNGEAVDDTEDAHVTDGSLERELERLWLKKDLATL